MPVVKLEKEPAANIRTPLDMSYPDTAQVFKGMSTQT